MKFWFIRLSASFFIIGAFGIGCLVGARYGLLIGLVAFCAPTALGIYLHKKAEQIKMTKRGRF